NLAAEPQRPLGLAMLDQRPLAGSGNIYRSEVSFLRRVPPAAPVGAAGDLGQIVDLARRLLVLSGVRTGRATTGGTLGRDGDRWVYGRGGRPCPRCGTRLARGELGEPRLEGTEPRALWFCPRCEADPGAPPTATRRERVHGRAWTARWDR